jgi:hypothetical protein
MLSILISVETLNRRLLVTVILPIIIGIVLIFSTYVEFYINSAITGRLHELSFMEMSRGALHIMFT